MKGESLFLYGTSFFLTLESKSRGLCSITELYPKTFSILRQVLGCCVVQSGFELTIYADLELEIFLFVFPECWSCLV